MAWGDKQNWLAGIAEETGETPQALLDRPDLPSELDFFRRAFNELRSDRQIGLGGVGAIPFTSIDRLAIRYGIDDLEEFERLCFLIRSMEDEERKRSDKPSEDVDGNTKQVEVPDEFARKIAEGQKNADA